MTSFPIASVTKLSTEIYQKDKKKKDVVIIECIPTFAV